MCTSCDVKVWLCLRLLQPPSPSPEGAGGEGGGDRNAVAIKWCKGCKNFKHWPRAFGVDKCRATKCARCRERQRNKYACTKKEEEEGRHREGTKKRKDCHDERLRS